MQHTSCISRTRGRAEYRIHTIYNFALHLLYRTQHHGILTLMTKADLPQKISYHLVFEPESEGGFTVTVPAISGCITYGATFEEAISNVREAILLCIEDMLERGEDVPTDTRAPIVSSIDLMRAEIHG